MPSMLRLKIMLVDDEMYVLESLKALLRENGHTVEGFNSPTKALEAFKKKGDFDLVISDIRMPEMTGGQLIAEIKKIKPDQHCIGITAYANKETLAPVIKSGGVDRILLKPWKNADVLNTVEQLGAAIRKKKMAGQAGAGPAQASS
nr:putative two-component response regulator protein [uncultured Gammaproteobacteria bacterium]